MIGASHRRSSDPLWSREFEIEYWRGVRIPTATPGLTLAADLYRPLGAGRVPALVTVLPYRRDTPLGLGLSLGVLRWFAQHGYACLLVDMRGTGSSDGIQRPPFDPDEADDALDAITWASEQDWCDGAVGMWGHSYGGFVTLRAASRRPPQLKAIIPIQAPTDPARDMVHPDGAQGFLEPLQWGTLTLLCQLLPPLQDFGSEDDQRRWKSRLDGTEPYIVELFRRGPSDQEWLRRKLDASEISVPAFWVAGWRDLFCDASVRGFTELSGPKKLLVGPWTHTMPQVAPVASVDFLSAALRWWDRWLRQIDNGVMDEPEVMLSIQGHRPEWRGYDRWPVPHERVTVVDTGGAIELKASSTPIFATSPRVIEGGTYVPDPTVGLLSGLWGSVATLPVPLDQRDDDTRSVTVTSAPLDSDLLMIGSPELTLDVATASEATGEDWHVIGRVSEIDRGGRSLIITSGSTSASGTGGPLVWRCWPTAYRVAAGHRLRVSLSDSDFPRKQPCLNTPGFRVNHLELRVPVVQAIEGMPVAFAAAPPLPDDVLALSSWDEPLFEIARDVVRDSVKLTMGSSATTSAPCGEYRMRMTQEVVAGVRRADPSGAWARARASAEVTLGSGQRILVSVMSELMPTAPRASAEITLDGAHIFDRSWNLGS